MADPLSITALTIAVGEIIGSLMKYTKSVKDSRPDARKLSEELFALKGILEHISTQVQPLSESKRLGSSSSEFLTTTLAKTDETLRSLLLDLGEPASKYKRLKQKLEWPLTREKLDGHLVRLERVKSCLMLVFTSDSNALHRDLHVKFRDLTTSLEDNLKIRKDEKFSNAHQDICRWLAPISPTSLHLRASKARLDQTGKWFIDTIFKEWLWGHDAYQQTLFILGKSGSGKTILFSHAVDELISMSADVQDVTFGYFYCSFGDVATQDPTNILGSILAQLSGSNPSILERFWPLYEAKTNSRAHKHPLDIANIEDAIIEHMSGDKPVVLLVDALNESCHSETILKSISRIQSKLPNMRVLLTGTAYTSSVEQASIMNMSVRSMKDDIDTFIRFTLEDDDMLKRLSQDLKDQIWEVITKGADGSFRWVQLSLDSLRSLRTVKKIREALQTLPRSLRDTYVSILERISENDWEISRAAFLWLSFSNRSLTLDELNEAVVLEETSTVVDEDTKLISPLILLEICQGLIIQDEFGKVNLAHASVKDFLTSEWINSSSVQYFSLNPSIAGKTLMRNCLTYLCLDNFQSGYVHSIDSILEREIKHPLLEYAAHFWASHGQSRNFDYHDHQIVDKLFSSRTLPRRGNFGVWVQTLTPYVDVEMIETTHPLYYAASFGLVPVVKAILEASPDIDIDAPGGQFGSTPLYVACWRGNPEVVELLLRAGADPYYPDPSTGLTVFSIPQKPIFAHIKEILSKAPLIPRDVPTRHTRSETPYSETGSQPKRRALGGDIEVPKEDSGSQKGAQSTGIEQTLPARSSDPLPLLFPSRDEFLPQIIELYPQLQPALAQRLAQEQCQRYERLARMREKHSQDIKTHSCRSGEHCIAAGIDAASAPYRQDSTVHQGRNILVNSYQNCTSGEETSCVLQFPPGVPLPPVQRLPAQFECPICFELKKFIKPSDWAKHVFEDVQPYTCTFPNCPDPKTFKRKADWVRHEMERHRHPDAWACYFPECGLTSPRKDNLIQHLVREHKVRSETNMETLWEMIEQCYRKEPPREERCQFCGDNLRSEKELIVHMGKHLQEIAMPVLGIIKKSAGF